MRFQPRHAGVNRALASACICALLSLCPFAITAHAQENRRHPVVRRKVPARAQRRVVRAEKLERGPTREQIERASGVICAERTSDPLGSVPIDAMQARPSLSLNHPEALAGARRARRLLPLSKEYVTTALNQLGIEYGIDPALVLAATKRVDMVAQVHPDPDLRDNASVMMSHPRTINFGTIFLVGLPSDEGMISVLSHELTHIADGPGSALAPLFGRIGKRAALLTGLRITGQRAEELGCDLVGAMAASYYVESTQSVETLPRRLARAVEHNCVDDDDTDADHLSPRSTLRAVLALNPALAHSILLVVNEVSVTNFSLRREMNRIQLGSAH